MQEYLVPGTKRGLRKDAVPTMYMSSKLFKDCEESLSHNTEEATFSGNSEVFVTSELLNKFSYPTSTRRHGNFAGVHTLLRIILSSNRKKRGILQSINVTRVTHLTPKCKKNV
ncbi:unnamed protein product [Tenebrio molitor]|nr:unnamed protein product [Tenebrio molitor]